jgi:urease gamma subunit
MEALVTSMVTESATRLGLASDSPAVVKAMNVAIAAVRDGRSVDEAFEFARSVLIQSVTPVGAAAA